MNSKVENVLKKKNEDIEEKRTREQLKFMQKNY